MRFPGQAVADGAAAARPGVQEESEEQESAEDSEFGDSVKDTVRHECFDPGDLVSACPPHIHCLPAMPREVARRGMSGRARCARETTRRRGWLTTRRAKGRSARKEGQRSATPTSAQQRARHAAIGVGKGRYR